IVGQPAPATERLAAELSLADRGTFTHGLSEEAFSALLARAEMAVVPSLYEGFSLPAVEHMASGTPLVASRTGALPEVTGDAAVLVTPGEDEELAAGLRRPDPPPAGRGGRPPPPRSGPRWRTAGCGGSASGSLGPRWPRPPSGSTWPRWKGSPPEPTRPPRKAQPSAERWISLALWPAAPPR